MVKLDICWRYCSKHDLAWELVLALDKLMVYKLVSNKKTEGKMSLPLQGSTYEDFAPHMDAAQRSNDMIEKAENWDMYSHPNDANWQDFDREEELAVPGIYGDL